MSSNADSEKADQMETLRRHYEQVCVSYRAIDDFRGKLLALWPVLGGAAGGVALLINQDGTGGLWAIAVFGFFVSIGLGVYEWHQTLRCDLLKKSARELERRMGFDVGTGQFRSMPRAFTPRTTGPPIQELKSLIAQEDRERHHTEVEQAQTTEGHRRAATEDEQRDAVEDQGDAIQARKGHPPIWSYPFIRVGIASAIVYVSVILGWLGLFLWAVLG
jgi:hypothetical protein